MKLRTRFVSGCLAVAIVLMSIVVSAKEPELSDAGSFAAPTIEFSAVNQPLYAENTSKSFALGAESFTDNVLNTRDDFLWGVNKHSNFYAVYSDRSLEDQIHYMAEMGAGILRIDPKTSDFDSTDKTVKLCNAYGIKVMFVTGGVSGSEVNYNYTNTYNEMKLIAERYNGKSGHGKVDYIQIDNECDIKSEFWTNSSLGSGDQKSDYKADVMEYVCRRFNNYVKAIRDADNDIKIVINHGWTHTGFLDWLEYYNVDYDIVGLDWYADMSANFINQGKRPVEQAQTIYNKYGKDIIICETNTWYSSLPNESVASTWDPLVTIINDAYTYSYIKGLIVYELCDNLSFESGSYNREAHFGIISTDRSGNMIGPKPIYYRLKHIWGGESMPQISIDTVMENHHNIQKSLDYYVDYSGNDYTSTYKQYSEKINLYRYAQIEFNALLTSSDSLRLWITDASGNKAYHDFAVTPGKWAHLTMSALDFTNVAGKTVADKTKIVGFMCECNAGAIKVNSFAFSNAKAPTQYNVVKELEYSVDYRSDDIFGTREYEKEVLNLNNYDYLEFDACTQSGYLRLWFYDSNGNRGFYDAKGLTANEWKHIVMPATGFDIGYGANGDKSKVTGFMCESYGASVKVDNMVFTSFAPKMKNTNSLAKALSYKISYNGNAPYSTLKYESSAFNLNDYDFVEFDIKYSASAIRSYFCDENGNRGYYDISGLKANEWNHIVIPASSFNTGNGFNGNFATAKGFMFEVNGSLNVANVALTEKAPDMNNTYNLEKTLDYSACAYEGNSSATVGYLANTVDIADCEFMEFDVFANSTSFNLYFLDENGKKGSQKVTGLNVNAWNHIIINVNDFSTEGSFLGGDKAKVKGFMCDGFSDEIRLSNLALTRLTPAPKYTYNLAKKLNYSLEYSGQDPWATKKSIGETVDLNDYDYIEMDVCISSSTLRFFFCDSSNIGNIHEGRGFYDFSGITPNKWCHLVMPATGFNTGYGMNGKMSQVVGFMCENATDYKVVNVALTNATSAYTYDLQTTLKYNVNYIGSDPWATKAFEGTTYNLNDYDYIEFDAYTSNGHLRLFFVDSTNRNANEGRGFCDCPTFTPNKWCHIVLSTKSFNTGYGMNGNRADVVGFLADGFLSSGESSATVRIKNVAFTNEFAPEVSVWGDVNGDEVVDVRDYVTVQYLIESGAAFSEDYIAVDFDGNKSVDRSDLDLILEYILGCVDSLEPNI